MTLFKWLRQAGQDEGAKPGVAGTDTTQISRSQHDQRLTVAAVLSAEWVDVAAALAALPLPEVAWRIRLAVGASNWLRPGAVTSPKRLVCHMCGRGRHGRR